MQISTDKRLTQIGRLEVAIRYISKAQGREDEAKWLLQRNSVPWLFGRVHPRATHLENHPLLSSNTLRTVHIL